MMQIIDLDIKEINLIEHLWGMNKDYHCEISSFFRENYSDLNFQGRFDNIDKRDAYKITVAKKDAEFIGYIISTIDANKGEHLSFHVNEIYRGHGIGKLLLNNHIKWLQDMKCESIALKVSYENESTINFYKSQGFKPDTLDMHLGEPK